MVQLQGSGTKTHRDSGCRDQTTSIDVILGTDPTKPFYAVEVQLLKDLTKVLKWPLQWLLIALDLKRTGELLVITHDPAVAAWIRNDIVAKGPCGPVITKRPRVLLLDEMAITKLLAMDNPWSAFAAAWSLQDAKVTDRTVELAVAVLKKAEQAEPELQGRMIRGIMAVLPEELNMTANHRIVTNEELDNSPGVRAFLRPSEDRAKAVGKVEGKAESVLLLLQTRGLAVNDENRARINACRDVGQLERWLVRSVSITNVEQLFVEE